MVKNLIIIVLVIALGVVAFKTYNPTVSNVQKIDGPTVPTPVTKASMKLYSNSPQGFSFEYPSTLYLKEKGTTGSSPLFSLILVDNTQENRDAIDGITSGARDWPTSIIVDVYENKNNRTPEDWVSKETNWKVDNGKTLQVNGIQSFFFSYNTLYPGKTYIFTNNAKTYVFSVNWLDSKDQIIKDFDMIVNSLSLK